MQKAGLTNAEVLKDAAIGFGKDNIWGNSEQG